jgi:hypothetical protein
MAQGPNRFVLEPCLLPDVAHEGMRMSAFAAGYWFGARG